MMAPLHLRKIFIGGLDYSTSSDVLKQHFSAYGDVVDAVVMKDHSLNRSRGFGFVTFTNADHVDAVQRARPHRVDGRVVETKRAMPRMETTNLPSKNSTSEGSNNRLFIGGLPQDAKEADIQQCFEKFGQITCVNIMYDSSSGRHRGFAFIDFNDYDPVDKILLTRHHVIKGRSIDVKKAISKADINKLKNFSSGNTTDAQAMLHTLLQSAASLPAQASTLLHPHATATASIRLRTAATRPHFPTATTVPIRVPANAIPTFAHNNVTSPFSSGIQAQLNSFTASNNILGAGRQQQQNPNNHGWQYSVSSTAEVLRCNAGSRARAGSNGSIETLNNQETSSNISSGKDQVHDQLNPELIQNISNHETSRNAATLNNHSSTKNYANAEVWQSNANCDVWRNKSQDDKISSSTSAMLTGIKSEPHHGISTSSLGIAIKCEDAPMSDDGMSSDASHIINGTGDIGPTDACSNNIQFNGRMRDDANSPNFNARTTDGNSTQSSSVNESLQNGSLDMCPPNAHLLFIEPFCGGSHKQLLQTILSTSGLTPPDAAAVFTLPAKKWHWRARTSALNFSQSIPSTHLFRVLFCSATLNLCELIGLRPDLAPLRKIIYFHENQLVYPVRDTKERDFQYGYNQILSALVADRVVFNSQYNLESFIREVPRHLNLQKDCRSDTSTITASMRAKSQVLYFPVEITRLPRPRKDALEPLHIIWPHRWEHDKDPETFFQVLFQLAELQLNFRVSVLGENFSQTPSIFEEAFHRLKNFIVNWGYAQTRDKYWEILHSGDVVVSTAHHEFFGVAMLEAVGAGCLPLCPNRLVYPEIYPKECLYNTQQQLVKALANFCRSPHHLRSALRPSLDLNNFSWSTLRPQYARLLDLAD